MAISLLAYVVIFSDSFIFEKASSSHFFRENFFKVTQELLFRSSSSFRAAAFFEELLFQNSHFFSTFFFQNSYFFRAKLLPSNHILRIGNSEQLPTEDIYRRATFSKYILLYSINFFQKSKILEKATFSEKQYSALPTFSGELPF